MKYYREINKLHIILQNIIKVDKSSLINFIQYKFSKLNKSKVTNFQPVQATLLTTARCNLNCPWCSFSSIVKNDSNKDLELGVESVKKLLKHKLLKKAISFILTGGEPLINKDIIPIISYLKKKGRIVGMITNGVFLNKKADELKKAGLDRLFISVYPDTIALLKKDLPSVTKKFKNIMLSKIILKSELINKDSVLEDSIKLAIETGCNGIQFMQLEALGDGENIKEDLILSDCKEFYEFKESMVKKYPKANIRWQDPYPATVDKKDRFCRRPWWEIIVNARGDCTFCCPLFGEGELSKNFNIYKNNLRNNPFWEDIRERLLDDKKECHKLCKFCNLLYDKDISRL